VEEMPQFQQIQGASPTRWSPKISYSFAYGGITTISDSRKTPLVIAGAPGGICKQNKRKTILILI
jgi:hypothetical protein